MNFVYLIAADDGHVTVFSTLKKPISNVLLAKLLALLSVWSAPYHGFFQLLLWRGTHLVASFLVVRGN